MSLDIHFWNIIVPKKVLESKYPGGSKQFKLNCPNKMFQEDEFLASYSFMNVHDVESHITRLRGKGLAYNEKNDSSEEFVVLAMEANGGLWWKVDWIDYNTDYFWFKEKNPQIHSEKNSTQNPNKSTNSQISLLNELKKSLEVIRQYTYKNFLTAFKLNEKDYQDATLFEATMSAFFLLDYLVFSKDVTKEFRDNLYYLCSTKILNEFSVKLRNKDLMDIIKYRYSSYAEIPGIRKEKWHQSMNNLLEVNLKGTKSLDSAKIVYPTTLGDAFDEIPLKMEFIRLEAENSYRTVRLVDEIFLEKSLEESLIILKSIENKNHPENPEPALQFVQDRDFIIKTFTTFYGKPKTRIDKKCKVYKWSGPFYSPAFLSEALENVNNIQFTARENEKDRMEIMITWYFSKGKELSDLEHFTSVVGISAKATLQNKPTDIIRIPRGEEWLYKFNGNGINTIYSLIFKRGFFHKKLLCKNLSFFQSYFKMTGLLLKLKRIQYERGIEALLPQNLSDDILNDFHKIYSDELANRTQSIESLNPLLFYVTMFRDYKKDFLSTIPFGLIVTNPADAARNINFFRSNPDIAKKLVELTGNLSERFEMEIRKRQEPWRVWPLGTKENILNPPGLKDASKVVEIQKEQAIRLYKSIKEGFGEEWLSNVYGIIILANKTSAIRIDNTSIKSIDSKEFLTPEEKEFGGTAFFFAERDEGTVIQVYYGDMGNIQSYLTPIQGMKLS
jgi:hypothetical protein